MPSQYMSSKWQKSTMHKGYYVKQYRKAGMDVGYYKYRKGKNGKVIDHPPKH